MATTFTCSRCRLTKTHTEPHTTGYGTDPKTGAKVCFACCALVDSEAMVKEGRATLYLTDKGVSNWPGTLRFKPYFTKTGRHNMAGVVTTAYFNGPDGKRWSAKCVGHNTQIAHCRRLASAVGR